MLASLWAAHSRSAIDPFPPYRFARFDQVREAQGSHLGGRRFAAPYRKH
jgi:hypothetical protein